MKKYFIFALGLMVFGNLFGSGGSIDVSLNDTWEQSFTAEW